MKKISIIGIGKLGICSALCFEKKGYDVLGLDIFQNYVDNINNKKYYSYEPYVNEYLQNSKNFRATTNLDECLNFSDIIFIVVQTPNSGGDKFYDHSILSNILMKINDKKVKNKHLIICCTVMPTYIDQIGKFLISNCNNCTLSYNPEFIAQGNIIKGFENPDMVLIGEGNKEIGDILENIYKNICDNHPKICRMSPLEAEITKISINGFITTKIAYCNMIADLSDKLGANKYIISNAISSDTRIGNKYFKPGYSYGGPCFPRDSRALAKCIQDNGLNANLCKSVDEQNELHIINDTKKLLKESKNEYIIENLCYKEDSKIPFIEE
jgi:nucleotide sugar dehydrogenase